MDNDTIPDRVVSDFDPPPMAPLDSDLLFVEKTDSKSGKKKYLPDWKVLRDHLHKEGRLSKED